MKKLVEHLDEVYVMMVSRNHYTEVVKSLYAEFEVLNERVRNYKENGYSERDMEDFDRIHAELDRIESAYWEDCKDGNKPCRTPNLIPSVDWYAVLDNIRDHLKDLMKAERSIDPDDEKNNPYMWDIFSFQEIIGCIEQKNYDGAYARIVEEFGEGYFEEFYL